MPWWKYYGFEKNPLDIRPNKRLFGVDYIEQKIIDSIYNGEIILLYGPVGSGKTSLAFKISDILKDSFEVIYLNGEKDNNPDIFSIVDKYRYKKILFIKIKNKKRIVLILDEFYNFTENVSKQVKYLYDNDIIHSALLIQISPELRNVTPSFINRISNKYEMQLPDTETIIKIIKYRLRNKIKIDENFLRYIISKNDRNIRSILLELNNILENMKHPIKDEISYDKNIQYVSINKDNKELKLSPQQLEILKYLFGNKLTLKKLSELSHIKPSSLSKQISRLYEKRIILKEEKDGKIYYYISPEYINEISKILGK